MNVTQVSRQAIPMLIAEQIQKLVVSGELGTGDKLPSERELCENFGASRTAVREAVSGLISKGILERRNNGIFVKEVDRQTIVEPMTILIARKNISINDILEVRGILDIESARLAAQRATEEDVEDLRRCVEEAEKPSSSEKSRRYHVADFHRLIAKATHNPLLDNLYAIIFEILKNDSRSIEELSESSKMHKDVFEKIRSRDAAGAEREMRDHISYVKDTYKRRE